MILVGSGVSGHGTGSYRGMTLIPKPFSAVRAQHLHKSTMYHSYHIYDSPGLSVVLCRHDLLHGKNLDYKGVSGVAEPPAIPSFRRPAKLFRF